MPQLSIVMPCLNRAEFVAEALDSIYGQGVDDVEVIVADGGSTDGTHDVLARYPQATIIIGPDQGLYDALNKAIQAATGEIIGHLNTDDVFLPGALDAAIAAFAADRQVEMASGGAELARRSSDGTWRVFTRYPAETYAELTWNLVLRGPILTNARFYRRALLDRCGPFDIRYRRIADRAFLMNVLACKPANRIIPQFVVQFRQHPGSLTFNDDPEAQWQSILERNRLAKDRLASAAPETDEAGILKDWGRYEAFLGVIVAIRKRSFAALAQAFAMGRSFGPGWITYLARSTAVKSVAAVRRARAGN